MFSFIADLSRRLRNGLTPSPPGSSSGSRRAWPPGRTRQIRSRPERVKEQLRRSSRTVIQLSFFLFYYFYFYHTFLSRNEDHLASRGPSKFLCSWLRCSADSRSLLFNDNSWVSGIPRRKERPEASRRDNIDPPSAAPTYSFNPFSYNIYILYIYTTYSIYSIVYSICILYI